MVEDGVTGPARRAAGGSPGGTVIVAYDIAAPHLKADNNRPPAIIWQPPYSSQSVAMADSRIQHPNWPTPSRTVPANPCEWLCYTKISSIGSICIP